MTRLSAPFTVKQAFAETTVAKIDTDGVLDLKLLTTVAVVSSDGAADAVPTSAAAYAPINVGGTEYVIALFNKED
jgi:hypothetical protein